MPVGSSTLSSGTSPSDAGRYVSDKLIQRSQLHFRFAEMADDRPLKQGMSKTAFFIRYERSDMPLTPISEGVTPQETPFSITEKSAVVDEWGMYMALTDVVTLTTQHPVLNEVIKLIADAMARVEEATIVTTLLGGTSVQYFDGSVATRAGLSTAATYAYTAAVFAKAIATLRDNGTPEKDGTYFYAVLGPQVEADIVSQSSIGGTQTWVNAATLRAQAGDVDGTMKGVIGAWLGLKLFRSNFIPKFQLVTTPLTVAQVTIGGALTGTVKYKVTKLDTKRGFEEFIQAEQSVSMTGDALQFTAPSTAGVVYNIYLGATTGDANLFLAYSNLPPSAVVNLTSLPTSGNNPPATPPSGVTVHPVFVFGEESLDWVPLDGMSQKGLVTPPGATDSDPLAQRRKAGSKFMAKASRRDDNRILRIELTSNF